MTRGSLELLDQARVSRFKGPELEPRVAITLKPSLNLLIIIFITLPIKALISYYYAGGIQTWTVETQVKDANHDANVRY